MDFTSLRGWLPCEGEKENMFTGGEWSASLYQCLSVKNNLEAFSSVAYVENM